jgi:hypothetical protein
MRIPVELELEADFDSEDNGKLRALTFPGQSQNLMQFMRPYEVEQARLSAMYHYEQGLLSKAAAIAERREMAGDIRRERVRDEKLIGQMRDAALTDFTYSQWKV